MVNRDRAIGHLILIVALVALAGGCNGTSGLPVSPSPPPPVAIPSPPLTIAAVSPDLGSTGGRTRVKITGTGIHRQAVVSLGVASTRGGYDPRLPEGTTIFVDSPAHAAGVVDVVITNPDGQSARLANGYTFASPDSFDFNGEWMGFALGLDITVGLTIRNNRLIGVICEAFEPLTFVDGPLVIGGEFSFSREDGVLVTGRIVSASSAVGTIHLGPCANASFGVSKR